jgi:hypothetical protein
LISNKWDIGDIFAKEQDVMGTFGAGNAKETIIIPDNCSVIQLSKNVNWTGRVHAVVTGGIDGDQVFADAYALSFKLKEVNGMKVIEGRLVDDYPDMPTPRYLHRSAGVKINGLSHLVVFGGKIN